MGITELPSKALAQFGHGGGARTQRVARQHHGGRGTTGCFHMKVELEGSPALWLTDGRGEAALSQIVMKHRRCCTTGRWMERGIGPYAGHECCARLHALYI